MSAPDLNSTENSKIGVGLVGYGLGGKVFHAPMISCTPGLMLTGIVQRAGTEAQQAHPEAKIFSSYAEMVDDRTIQLIVISTPNVTHFEIACAALNAGKHVIIDKPMTVSSREANQLLELAAKNHVILSPFHNRRWDGDFLTVAKLISEGRLGTLTSYGSYFDRYRPQIKPNAWRERPDPGSGVLFDLAPHLLDQAFVLFGLPDSIEAELLFDRPGVSVDDGFNLLLGYKSLKVHVGATMGRIEVRPRFVVTGSSATFTKTGIDPQEADLKSGKRPEDDMWGAEPPECWGELRANSPDAQPERVETLRGDYRRYYENVRDAILGKARLPVTPVDGRNVIRAIELAMEAAQRRSPVAWS